MKFVFAAATVALAAIVYGPAPASAQWAPWCAQYQDKGAARICAFGSFAACQASVSGVGGFCLQNPGYGAYGRTPWRYRRY